MAAMPNLTRREMLSLAPAGLVALRRAPRARATLRFMAVGQALILRDIATQDRPGFDQMREKLAQADVAFSNLEVAVRGASARDAPARGAGVAAEPVVLDSLRALSFDLLSLANNHAGDLGVPGLLSTIEETRRRGFGFAGTGRTLEEASQPGYLETPKGRVALVAMASRAVAAPMIATSERPGVHHVAMTGTDVDPVDAARTLAAIRTAAARAPWVVVYQHDHYWARDWQETPEWKKRWCRACIDAGATVFVSHGVPLLHGIEIYKGRPIFYGLGNFVFHVAIKYPAGVPSPYGQTECWQSVIADCELEDGRLRALTLDPITLMSTPGRGESAQRLHGNPRLAEGQEAREILDRLARLSKPLGTTIDVTGTRAVVRI
jgi:poly-gamma-glutamate capsule biosynthesis protein CapA/YwtB (metallophosphatase superfamily)